MPAHVAISDKEKKGGAGEKLSDSCIMYIFSSSYISLQAKATGASQGKTTNLRKSTRR